jgi:hypothetical protein
MRQDSAAQRLRAANPVRSGDLPSADSAAARVLFERIVATEPKPAPARKGLIRRRPWVLLPAAALLAAAGYGLVRQVSDPRFVVCYAEARLDAEPAEVSPDGQAPVVACAFLWEPGGQFNQAGDPAPPLVACVLENGLAGVFPDTLGPDTCSALGMARQRGGSPTTIDPVARLQEVLSAEVGVRCLGRDEAMAFVREQLAALGLTEWTVEAPTPFTQGAPCASVAMDIATKTVILVPHRDPSSG